MTTKEEFLELLKEEILNLINIVFNYTTENPLSTLIDLSNEFTLKSLILEIEPNIEKTCGFIDLTKDNKFGIRYANLVAITKCVFNFIDKNSERLRDKGYFKNHIIINDIISNNREQIILLGKMLIILFTIAPNNDSFLGKINTLETTSQEIYINIIEEFLKSDNSFNTSRFSDMNNSVFQTKNSFLYKYEDFERENKKLKQQIGDLNMRISDLSKQNSVIDLKYKDCRRELEMSRTTGHVHSMTAKDSLEIEELKSKHECKDNELFEFKIKYDREVEKNNNEINKFKEIIEKLNYELLEFKQVKKEYEGLKIKVKELAKYKELCADYNNLLTTIDNRNKQIETLNNEKRGYASHIEKVQKEMIIEKDRFRQLEYEKKKIEYDLNDMKADVSRMEVQIKRKDTYNNLNNISEVKKDMTEALQDKYNFLDMDKDSIIFELDKNKDERSRNLEKEINDLRLEKQEILKNYRSQIDDIHIITEEKNKILEQLDDNVKEKDKLLIDKGKIEIQLEKLQLEIQKNNMNYNMNYNKLAEEKKALEDGKKELEEKIEIQAKEKTNLQKEIEVYKLQNHNLKLNLEKFSNENKNLHNEIESAKHFNINTDATSSTIPIFNKLKKSSPKNNQATSLLDNEVSNLRNEFKVKNIFKKSNLAQKDEMIKMCRDKIRNLENENKSLFAQITENQEKNRNEMHKKLEDFEFYRRSYEEQRNRVNREHELISSSLYELASQFMFLKKEMQKKITPENPSKI